MPKALVPYRGRLLVEHAVDSLHWGGCDRVTVVLGAGAEQVLARADLAGADEVLNPDWASGLGSSLRAGLAALTDADPDEEAVLIRLVDTPGIGPDAVRRIIDAARAEGAVSRALVQATYRGEPGHPVLIGRAYWPDVRREATGDRGAGPFLRQATGVLRVPCEDIADGTDIDTPI
jgi:nicotine blue oxidoreductase